MKSEIPRLASPPDPAQDQPGDTMPEHIAFILHAVGILLGYGRHLLATVRHRATAPTFPTIAASFGTANLATILAHLNRGILRATALQHVLLAPGQARP
jgi:glutamine synthetase type III